MNRNYRHQLLGLLCFGFLFVAGCTTEIQHDLTEVQANEIIVLFSKAGIQAEKLKNAEGRTVTYTIVVNKADMVKAIELLRRNNLPPKKEKGFPEVFGQTGMIPTASEERAKYLMALSGELHKTLKKIKGVLDARVHLVIPQDKILKTPNSKPVLPTASVLLIVRSTGFSSGRAKQVWERQLRFDAKRLVANSLESLNATKVNVVIRPASGAMAGAASTSTGGDSGSATQMKNFLGIQVASSSMMKFRLILGAGGLLCLLLAAGFIFFFIRASSLKNKLNALSNNAY